LNQGGDRDTLDHHVFREISCEDEDGTRKESERGCLKIVAQKKNETRTGKKLWGGIWVRIGQVQWIGLGFKTEQLEEQLSNQFNRDLH